MAKLSVYNIEGNQVGEIELNDAVFGVEVNENLMHKAVVAQLAASRQGTQSAKTRSEVSGGGRKPWRQKGTGHARQGSTRSPQWTGGGVVFAPKPRDYSIKLNKKERRLAIKSALTTKVNESKLIVLDSFELDEIKTKKFVAVMNNLKAENLGQMNLYLNYYEQVVNDEYDNKPIGIILCTEKDNVMMEFALNGISNNLFTSTYTYYIPNKEQLIGEVEKVLKNNDDMSKI